MIPVSGDAEGARARVGGWDTRAATWLAGGQFFVFGIAIGVMTVVWAEVILDLAIDEGVFGTAHLLLPVVGLLTLLSAKRLYRHADHRGLAIAGQVALLGMLVTLALGTGIWSLLLAFVLAGLGSALIDTAANSVFMEIETATGRDVMNVMYAVNSGGTVISALGVGALISAGVDYRWTLALSALVLLPVLVASFLVAYPPVDREVQDAVGAPDPGGSVNTRTLLRNRLFRVVFVMTFLAIAVESIVQVWSVIYVDQLLELPIVIGGAAFALFSLMMMVGRLINAWLVSTFGIRWSFLMSALGTTLSGAVLMTVPSVGVSVCAFVLMGLAIAGVQPTCLSASARVAPSHAGIVAAGMMTPAYMAFIATPTAYGWLADFTSLNTAMVIVLLAGVGIGLLGLDSSVGVADRTAATSDDEATPDVGATPELDHTFRPRTQ